jgi:predicted nuclease of restriction endonuclease-like RecB superfamily
MLSRQHAIAEYDWTHGRVLPDRLHRTTHAHYLRHAERMLEVYRNGVGRTRGELHRSIERILADECQCPARRIRAFCKLLDDAGTYQKDRAGNAAKLRGEVFRRAASFHPLVSHPDTLFEYGQAHTKEMIAREMGTTWSEIDQQLFADVIEFQRLETFTGYADGAALLARYNVAQAQVALYDAIEMIVQTKGDLKRILRGARLAGLMHTIRQMSSGTYEIRLDGPASVLRNTRRYGVAMAMFLPTLLACQGWSLRARLRSAHRDALILYLSPADGLKSHLPPADPFDSDLERRFAERWGDEPRGGWTLHRESALLSRGQKVFVPDFEFRHADGRRVLMEVIGYWTPEYLEKKQQTLDQFADVSILLALAQSVELDRIPIRHPTIRFKTSLKVEPVIEVLQRFDNPFRSSNPQTELDWKST